MVTTQQSKKKCRQYSVEYLKYGFIPAPHNQQLPMCLVCDKVFTNDSMKPCKLSEHLTKKHSDKADKSLSYFQILRDQFRNGKQLTVCLLASQSQPLKVCVDYNFFNAYSCIYLQLLLK